MTTRRLLAALAAVVAVTATACSGGDPAPTPSPVPSTVTTSSAVPTPPSPPTRTPTSAVTPAYVVATYDSSQTDGGMAAQLWGTGVVRNGCFFVRLDDPDPNGQDLVLPVFPDQRIRAEGSRTYFNDDELREGGRIQLGGGFVRANQGANYPRGCRGQRTVFVVADT